MVLRAGLIGEDSPRYQAGSPRLEPWEEADTIDTENTSWLTDIQTFNTLRLLLKFNGGSK
ncbi:MAG: hypothetical protein A07HR60_00177 [uncultured archaeon A07HR60]|nr:MAG: hypothetical protein A07HR60_00177 [uncultured archaeon A07HR60]